MGSKSKALVNILVFIVAFFLLSSLRGQTMVNVSFDDDTLTLTAPKDYSLVIEYDQVETVDLVDSFDPGTVISGDENRSCRWGTWENSDWGQYTLAVSKKIDNVILLTTATDERIAFNFENETSTAAMHQMFTELLAHRGDAVS